MKPVVSIVGRPNVGKSSLFNRILGRTKALVEDEPGVTRDRNYAVAEYGGRAFILVDTGGFEDEAVAPEDRKGLARIIREAATAAVEEADVVVIVLDGKDGPNPSDADLVEHVRRSHKPVVHAINKIDHTKHVERTYEFYELGIEDAIPVSAAHNLGVDELLDAVLEKLPLERSGPEAPEPWQDEGSKPKKRAGLRRDRLAGGMPEETTTGPDGWREDGDAGEGEGTDLPQFDDEDFVLRVAVLGRPNVGKSTLVNRLLGFERSLVSDVAGTTRDSIDTYIEIGGRRLILIDTAGIRRRAKVSQRIEKMTVQRALRMVEAAHVVYLLLDAVEGVTDQDARLGELARKRGRALVLVANKWDLVKDKDRRLKELRDQVKQDLPHLTFAPVTTLSALHGAGVNKLMPLLEQVSDAHRSRIETGALNRWLKDCLEAQSPPLHHHHAVKMYYATQVAVRPPRIVVFCSSTEGIAEHYKRYMVNKLRASFPLEGTPVLLTFRKR